MKHFNREIIYFIICDRRIKVILCKFEKYAKFAKSLKKRIASRDLGSLFPAERLVVARVDDLLLERAVAEEVAGRGGRRRRGGSPAEGAFAGNTTKWSNSMLHFLKQIFSKVFAEFQMFLKFQERGDRGINRIQTLDSCSQAYLCSFFRVVQYLAIQRAAEPGPKRSHISTHEP